MAERRFHDSLKIKLILLFITFIKSPIEGFARKNNNEYKNFLRISYGSLKETIYIIEFSNKEKYIGDNNYKILIKQADEIAAMLWTT